MQIEEVPISKIKPDPKQPRVDFSGIAEMAETMKEKGVIQPLIVREDGVILDGERRWRAAKMAGLKTIPVIFRANGVSDTEKLELQLIFGFHEEKPKPEELAPKLKEWIRQKNANVAFAAQTFGLSSDYVRSLVGELADLEPDEKKAIKLFRDSDGAKGLAPATIIEIRQKIPEMKEKLIKKAEQESISRAYVRFVSKTGSLKKDFSLPFRLTHKDPILKGIKTQTSRTKLDSGIEEGKTIKAAIWEPGFADLEIVRVEKKRLGDFDENDAKREGGYTLEEFKSVWKNLHKKWNPHEKVNIIHFKLKSRAR